MRGASEHNRLPKANIPTFGNWCGRSTQPIVQAACNCYATLSLRGVTLQGASCLSYSQLGWFLWVP